MVKLAWAALCAAVVLVAPAAAEATVIYQLGDTDLPGTSGNRDLDFIGAPAPGAGPIQVTLDYSGLTLTHALLVVGYVREWFYADPTEIFHNPGVGGASGLEYFTGFFTANGNGRATSIFTPPPVSIVNFASADDCAAQPAGTTCWTFYKGPELLPQLYISYDRTGGPASLTISVDAAPVPEPAAWALMVAGFGLAGAGLRRRRSTVAAG